jgi:flagellar L-ring protein precursor FlgH
MSDRTRRFRSLRFARGNAWPLLAIAVTSLSFAMPTLGQTSSIRVRHARASESHAEAPSDNPRVQDVPRRHPLIEAHSFSAVKVKPPRQFLVHDLITIIIREQSRYESDSELESEKEFKLRSILDAFLKIDDERLGASTFPNGKPNIDYRFESKLNNEAEKDREDRLVTRITASVIDIKPNGNLVLEAKARVIFDDEVSTITLMGVARSGDVNPDNTILSTQLANKEIMVHNVGAVRDGSRRGWIPRFLDLSRPF